MYTRRLGWKGYRANRSSLSCIFQFQHYYVCISCRYYVTWFIYGLSVSNDVDSGRYRRTCRFTFFVNEDHISTNRTRTTTTSSQRIVFSTLYHTQRRSVHHFIQNHTISLRQVVRTRQIRVEVQQEFDHFRESIWMLSVNFLCLLKSICCNCWIINACRVLCKLVCFWLIQLMEGVNKLQNFEDVLRVTNFFATLFPRPLFYYFKHKYSSKMFLCCVSSDWN